MNGCGGGGVAVSAGNAVLRHIGGTRIGISGTARGGKVVTDAGGQGEFWTFCPGAQIHEKRGCRSSGGLREVGPCQPPKWWRSGNRSVEPGRDQFQRLHPRSG